MKLKYFQKSDPRFAHSAAVPRGMILFLSILSLFISQLYRFTELPFPKEFFHTIFVGGLFHLFLFMFFRRLYLIHPQVFALASVFNLILLGFAVHYSGGVQSPFIFVFFIILISDATFGIEFHLDLIIAILVYLGVIGAEAIGLINPIALSPKDIYANLTTTLWIVFATTGFMVATAKTYWVLMRNMRNKLDMEHESKKHILAQLMKLEAPSQIGHLANKIVHDIRGPLGAISGFVKILQAENKLTPESQEDCAVMSAEIKRITNLVDRLIKYVRPGQLTKDVLCPVDLVETVLLVMSFYPGARRIEFIRDFPAKESLRLYADKEELQQVIFNIFKNSIEALDGLDNSPFIRIKIHGSVPHVFIVIQDNGRGIPKGLLSRLHREVISTKKEGAGVGLVIAREILESYQGQIEIQSEENKGTVVTIRLPLYLEKLEKFENISPKEVLEKQV
ncbi:MAG: GHKL domain-containing protein [Elusimicrobia bacterium]|nr:GHKL domain-containing protein [Candidatus Obscuribacterium magneticum]